MVKVITLCLAYCVALLITTATAATDGDSTSVPTNAQSPSVQSTLPFKNNQIGMTFCELYGIELSYTRRLSQFLQLRVIGNILSIENAGKSELSFHCSQSIGASFYSDRDTRMVARVGMHEFRRTREKESLDSYFGNSSPGTISIVSPFVSFAIEIDFFWGFSLLIDIIYDDLMFRSFNDALPGLSVIPVSLRTLSLGLNYAF